MQYASFQPPRLTNDEWFTGDDGGHKSVVELSRGMLLSPPLLLRAF